ncbi:hypothetical protein MLD38_012419 [Melastoma candidum]|uniref:Uncharacterized protein n=1 Tax=Melastoma candidum TaxID=119954 RepID=A0ACB9REQ2_9MYRT|nr:hypothetical protein MLD38_012419 [Melastoma candidum]
MKIDSQRQARFWKNGYRFTSSSCGILRSSYTGSFLSTGRRYEAVMWLEEMVSRAQTYTQSVCLDLLSCSVCSKLTNIDISQLVHSSTDQTCSLGISHGR